jgi:hypothetical protein
LIQEVTCWGRTVVPASHLRTTPQPLHGFTKVLHLQLDQLPTYYALLASTNDTTDTLQNPTLSKETSTTWQTTVHVCGN